MRLSYVKQHLRKNSMDNESLDTISTSTQTGVASKNLVEDGLYNAVCIGIADAGYEESEFDGRTKTQRKVSIAFAIDARNGWNEIPVVTKKVTLSFCERSNLLKLLVGWKVPYDHLTDIIGKNCQVLLCTSQDGKYNNLSSVLPPKSKMEITKDIFLPGFWFDLKWKIYPATEVNKTRRPKPTAKPAAPLAAQTYTPVAPVAAQEAPKETAAQSKAGTVKTASKTAYKPSSAAPIDPKDFADLPF